MTGFNYHEYDMLKFGTTIPGPRYAQSLLDRSTLNFEEYLGDLEHDQGRHQGIQGHGQGEACYDQRIQRCCGKVPYNEVHPLRPFVPFVQTSKYCRIGNNVSACQLVI